MCVLFNPNMLNPNSRWIEQVRFVSIEAERHPHHCDHIIPSRDNVRLGRQQSTTSGKFLDHLSPAKVEAEAASLSRTCGSRLIRTRLIWIPREFEKVVKLVFLSFVIENQNSPKSKEFYFVLLVWIKEDPPLVLFLFCSKFGWCDGSSLPAYIIRWPPAFRIHRTKGRGRKFSGILFFVFPLQLPVVPSPAVGMDSPFSAKWLCQSSRTFTYQAANCPSLAFLSALH